MVLTIKKPLYCSKHRKDDTENVVNKRCEYDGCKKQPRFGIDKIKFCAMHKTNNMINLKERLCTERLCVTRPNYGYKGKKAIYCTKHKKINMVDVKHKICQEGECMTVANSGYLYRNPTHCARHRKPDMTVGKVCGSFRPDFVFDLNTHFVVIECDEDQHKQYDEMCEIIRMYNIYQSLGLPVHFLRYNPDKFKLNNVNISVHKKERLNVLKHIFSEKIQKIPNNITATKLFYDGNDGFISNMDVDKVIQIGTKD